MAIRLKVKPDEVIRIRADEGKIVWKESSAGAYTGEHVFTPSSVTQTIHTANKAVQKDIIINPIPSNYGKITYNGTSITVS